MQIRGSPDYERPDSRGTADAFRVGMPSGAEPSAQPAQPTHPVEAAPPQPRAGTPPRIRLTALQRVGLPLLALVPLLAMGGLFGERRDMLAAADGSLLVRAHVPTRFRYRQRMTLELSVTNRGPSAVEDLRVRIDSSYLDRFSAVTITPFAAPDGAVHAGALAVGASTRLTVTLEGEDFGAIRGDAIATDAAGDTAHVALRSTVFP